jgi:uncharacterized protein YdeI (YjbR/CyaY-like superfamily)
VSPSYEQVTVGSRAEWRRWLAKHHATSPGIWLVLYKKGSGRPTVPYEDLVEEALCFGWIDSTARKLDEERRQQLLTPRKPRSRWSSINRERVARLAGAGLMRPAGMAAVEVAQANGNWTALDAVERLEEPDDLRTALDAKPAARASWDGFPPSAKRAILDWISTAKRRETRGRRIAQTVSEAAAGRRASQPRSAPN